MSLSVKQLLLLENLTYTYDKSFPYNYLESYEGQTIEAFLNVVKDEIILQQRNYEGGINSQDWLDIFHAIRSDERLMNMEIAMTHRDKAAGGSGGFSVLFFDEAEKEAVFAFKGTQGSGEWRDNFQGAAATDTEDGVSTRQQLNALEWYRQAYESMELQDCRIIVTGHSKGGNKAKYITIMDDTVERCVSFDGQGFSDLFLKKYESRIHRRKYVIENHCVDRDFVNPLMNDVGAIYFYSGFGIDKEGLGFAENHSPNTFFDFGDYSKVQLVPAVHGRAEGMEFLDNLLNSLVRSLGGSEQKMLAAFLGEVAIKFLGMGNLTEKDSDERTDIASFLVELSTSPAYMTIVAYSAAYLLRYLQDREQLKPEIRKILVFYDMEKMIRIGDALTTILNSTFYHVLIKSAVHSAAHMPAFVLDQMGAMVNNVLNAKLSRSQIIALIDLLRYIPVMEKRITELPDGRDNPAFREEKIIYVEKTEEASDDE